MIVAATLMTWSAGIEGHKSRPRSSANEESATSIKMPKSFGAG